MDETFTQEEVTPPSQTTILTTPEEQTLANTTLETDNAFTESPYDFDTDVITILIYAAPAIILVLLIPLIILIVQRKRRKKQHEDVRADENVKSPIFEEDTPSVMEIEMDDLDKWMSNMKNSCRLSTLEEENKFNSSVES